MLELPLVLVIRDRTVKGIDHLGAHDDGREHGQVLPLDLALDEVWPTDAHAQPIFVAPIEPESVEAGFPRFNSPALPAIRAAGYDLCMGALFYDIDNQPHQPHTEDSFVAFLEAMDAMPEHLRPACWFTTRKGGRIVYVLDEPLPVDDAERAHRGFGEVLRLAGVPIDEACHSNWTRLYRMPRVMRDNERTDHDQFFRFEAEWDRRITAADLPRRGSSASVSPLAAVDGWEEPQPTQEEAMRLLAYAGKETDFYKQARAVLRHRGCAPIIFEAQPIGSQGSRDNKLFGLVKQCFRELRKSKLRDLATPPRVFALFYKAVEQLEPDHDTPSWLDNLWVKCCREWRQCVGQEEAERDKNALGDVEPAEVAEELVDRLRDIYGDQVPRDEFGGNVWAQQHTMAVVAGRHFFLMRSDGTYSQMPCDTGQLVPAVRAMGIDKRIEMQTVNVQTGLRVRKPTDQLISEYGTAVYEIAASIHCDYAYIEKIDTDEARMVIPAYKLRDWDGEFSEDVDKWLRLIAGSHYDLLEQWIVRALDFRNGAICALSLTGPPSVGKKLIVRGLAECINTEILATGLDFESYQTDALLKTCFLSMDEDVPEVTQLSAVFRRYVGGEEIAVNQKYKPVVRIKNPMRVIITCNYNDVIHALAGSRQLSLQDQEALALRILHIEARQEAADWLAKKGGLAFTAAAGKRWIGGDAGQRSDYIVAKHFMFLYHNRPRHQLGRRLLMEGNVQDVLIREMRTRGGAAPEVLETLAWMIESKDTSVPISIDEEGVWITPKSVCDVYQMQFRTQGTRLNTKIVGRVLDGICELPTEAPVWKKLRNGSKFKARWRRVWLHHLLEYAQEVGLPNNKLSELCEQFPRDRPSKRKERHLAAMNVEVEDDE